MIIDFKEAVIKRIYELQRIDAQRNLTVKEMDEFFYLLERYGHFLKECDKDE